MEEPRATNHQTATAEESQSQAAGRAAWQSIRRPRRGRVLAQQAEAHGPYETSYSITTGYPDREIVVP